MNDMNMEWVRLKSSAELADEWNALNPGRDAELCDILDACQTLNEKRQLYATFTKDERNCLIDEYCVRKVERMVPIGSMVGPLRPCGYNIARRDASGTHEIYATTTSTATVIGHKARSAVRYVMLHQTWRNKEGDMIWIAEVSAHDLEVLQASTN